MTLFLFTAHGQLFALPGESVRQVLFPGAHDLSLEPGGTHARHAGRRLPVVALPEARQDDRKAEAEEWSTFLHLVLPGDRECLLGVESAGGLAPTEPGDVLPLPPYLFPEGGQPYVGMFLRGQKTGLLLQAASLAAPGSPG